MLTMDTDHDLVLAALLLLLEQSRLLLIRRPMTMRRKTAMGTTDCSTGKARPNRPWAGAAAAVVAVAVAVVLQQTTAAAGTTGTKRKKTWLASKTKASSNLSAPMMKVLLEYVRHWRQPRPCGVDYYCT